MSDGTEGPTCVRPTDRQTYTGRQTDRESVTQTARQKIDRHICTLPGLAGYEVHSQIYRRAIFSDVRTDIPSDISTARLIATKTDEQKPIKADERVTDLA